jgi:hypothetical protein
VVERAEHEHGIGGRVVDVQVARVADAHRCEGAACRGACLLDVQLHRVERVNLVARARQRQRVGASGAADIEHDRGRRREIAIQERHRARELEPPPVAQAACLLAQVVVGGDLRVVGHRAGP